MLAGRQRHGEHTALENIDVEEEEDDQLEDPDNTGEADTDKVLESNL